MLYVFLVDTGTMIQLDLNLAVEKVSYLKGYIARNCRIPQEKQVLLISGGESLDPEQNVCTYAAGTDTNPIFLFSMLNIESAQSPEVLIEFNEIELNEKVSASIKMEDTQSTVSIRATIAQEFVKASSDKTHMCEMLIHDQHLQHQGWSAVVANLEDLAFDLKKHSERLVSSFSEYLDKRESHLELIDNFDEDLAVLHRIPVFPSLLHPDVNPEMSMVSSVNYFNGAGNDGVTLLDWINQKGSSQSMDVLSEGCYRSLQKLDPELMERLKSEVTSAIEGAQNQQMKEIRGLGERLAGLEQLLLEAKRLVQEQQSIAAAFLQNQQRASGLRDVSILPDLCASHRQQLNVMKDNHQQIISICNRTAKAKNELSDNLHKRMKWVVFIQNKISEVGQSIVMHVEELKRLLRKLDVVEQIHMAPSIYLATAVEVVRRRAFTEQYMKKAVNIADNFSTLHSEEFSLRNNFHVKLKKHFLSKMFPGMEDVPPAFATERPPNFDKNLPVITLKDIQTLRNKFPDLAKSLQLPEENALSNLLAKSFNQTLTQEDGETLFSLQNMPRKISLNTRDIGSMSVMNQLITGVRKPSSRMSALSDSDDSDDDPNPRARRFSSNGKKKSKGANKDEKLTRSLPHESVTSLTTTNLNLSDPNDPSSSSADPSTSSNNTTGTNSVAPSSSSGDGSVMKTQTGSQMQDSSLGRLTEERVALISSLNCKIQESEAKLAKLQGSMISSLQPCTESITNLKTELHELKTKLVKEREEFQVFYESMSEKILSNVLKANEKSNKRLSLVMEDVESRVRKESESDLDKIRCKLELEMQKLEDCHREIDIYRQQLEQTSHEVDKLKVESIEAREQNELQLKKLTETNELEKADIIKKLTLEHEIELDALREELENSEKVANIETESKRLREILQLKENDIEALRRKTRLMEMTQEERFHEEKEKIVQILEAGFAQRERLSLEKREDDLKQKFEKSVEEQKIQWEEEKSQALALVKREQQFDFDEKLSQMDKAQKMNIEQMIQKATEEMKQKFDLDREAALKQQKQDLTIKAKRELDALRTRFKMMQTAGALERSPSCSESDSMSYESPRQDFIESIRSTIKLEYENELRVEKSKWERQLQEIKEEHEQALVEVMSREKIRDIAEQQVMFNEALNKAMEEKNKKLVEISEVNARLEEELASSHHTTNKNGSSSSKSSSDGQDLVQQLADLGQKNTRLEAELKEAKAKLDQAMASSVMSLPRTDQDPDLQRLQKENAHLKEQLTKSMMALVSSGKVTVASVDRGDTIMVVWNEDHNNFSIYTEPAYNLPLHFLHNESLVGLGLNIPPNHSSRMYITAEVVDKEYCQAKKSENRFRVPQGTKFYRVKCKPTPIKENKSNGN